METNRENQQPEVKVDQYSSFDQFNWLDNTELIWYDKTDELFRHASFIRILRRRLYQHVEMFDDLEKCENYIRTSQHHRIFLITSLEEGQYIIPNIHDLSQLYSAYIYNATKTNQLWTEKYSKVYTMPYPDTLYHEN
ncbi:unnamed protein product [Rotaria magnacalcarata]|uniref:Uncharacterized protein n=2 Tax=Rotaria magnacalcarata TaxID=392030 RepID=A0A820M1H3_9BILA|nr:unnamed protein product [Rotaria magnacalcarata]